MKRRLKKEQTKLIYILLFLLTSFLFTKAQHTVLKNLNLLDVINGKTITGKAISIQNGVITQIDELAKIEITKSTKLIDLKNQFVSPGLYDMHLHLPHHHKLDTCLNTILAAGVTNVRIMYSEEDVVKMKKQIDSKTIKPTIYYPYILTDSVDLNQPTELMRVLRETRSKGLQFIKLFSAQTRNDFSETTFLNFMKAANASEITVCGHYPGKIKYPVVAQSGFKSLEHLAVLPNQTDSLLTNYIELTKLNQLYTCPTLDWFNIAYLIPYPKGYLSRMTLHNAPKHYFAKWQKQNKKNAEDFSIDSLKKYQPKFKMAFEKRLTVLKKLHDAGCLLIVGGESELEYQLEGFNVYEEMMIWKKAGIPDAEILKSATYIPSTFFKEQNQYGSIELGKIAQLAIFSKNPLTNIENIKTIHATFLNNTLLLKKDLLK
jgi:imidazolonepropionase-like amidohydrolase